MKTSVMVAAIVATPLIAGWPGPAAAEFKVCTWGWILENCEAATCDTAKPCRDVVIDYYVGRANRSECKASDKADIARRCKKCNADNCPKMRR